MGMIKQQNVATQHDYKLQFGYLRPRQCLITEISNKFDALYTITIPFDHAMREPIQCQDT